MEDDEFKVTPVLTPYEYPLWIRLSAGILSLAVILSIVLLPRYFIAARKLKSGIEAYKNKNFSASIQDLKYALKRAPTSKKSKIAIAKAYFANDDAEDDEKGLGYLHGVKLDKRERADLMTVMPAGYEGYLETYKKAKVSANPMLLPLILGIILLISVFMPLLTFPGRIVHEIAHRFFCDITGTPVYEVAYFNVEEEESTGHVMYGPAAGLKSIFLISIGPLIINTLLCALLTFPPILPIFILGAENCSVVFKILIWVGFSMGMNAFPSNTDMEVFREAVEDRQQGGILLAFAKLLAGLFRMLNFMAQRALWDLLYAFGISLMLPLVFGLL